MPRSTTVKIDFYAVKKNDPYDFKMLTEMFVVDVKNELHKYRTRPIGKTQLSLEEIIRFSRTQMQELESSFMQEVHNTAGALRKLDEEEPADRAFFDGISDVPDLPEIREGMTRQELLLGKHKTKMIAREYDDRLKKMGAWKEDKERKLQEMEDMLSRMEENTEIAGVLDTVLREADNLSDFVKIQHQELEKRISRKTMNVALSFFFLAGIVTLVVSLLTSRILQQILPVFIALLSWVAFSLFFRLHWSKRIQAEQKDEYWRIFNLVKIEVRRIKGETESKYDELIQKLDEDVIEMLMANRGP